MCWRRSFPATGSGDASESADFTGCLGTDRRVCETVSRERNAS